MSKKITWAEIKEVVNKLSDDILKQPATIWNESEDTGHCVTGIKILDEDWHYDGDEGCLPFSLLKEHDDDYEENKDEYYIVHASGTPILLLPQSVMQ